MTSSLTHSHHDVTHNMPMCQHCDFQFDTLTWWFYAQHANTVTSSQGTHRVMLCTQHNMLIQWFPVQCTHMVTLCRMCQYHDFQFKILTWWCYATMCQHCDFQFNTLTGWHYAQHANTTTCSSMYSYSDVMHNVLTLHFQFKVCLWWHYAQHANTSIKWFDRDTICNVPTS